MLAHANVMRSPRSGIQRWNTRFNLVKSGDVSQSSTGEPLVKPLDRMQLMQTPSPIRASHDNRIFGYDV